VLEPVLVVAVEAAIIAVSVGAAIMAVSVGAAIMAVSGAAAADMVAVSYFHDSGVRSTTGQYSAGDGGKQSAAYNFLFIKTSSLGTEISNNNIRGYPQRRGLH